MISCSMHLYALTLQKPTGIVQAVFGNFSSASAQEIVVGRGKVLELLRPNDSGKVQTILSMEIFGVIRSVAAFRLTGACPRNSIHTFHNSETFKDYMNFMYIIYLCLCLYRCVSEQK